MLLLLYRLLQPATERVQALADISRSAQTKPVHRLQIRPVVHNYTQLKGIPYHSLSYIRVHAAVWEGCERQTDTHTDGRDQYTFRLGYASREM